MPLEQTAWSTFKDVVYDAYPIKSAMEDIANVSFSGGMSGEETLVCCPFHNEKNPSMSVNIKKGIYYCHAAGCGATGNTFTFIREYLGLSFSDAILYAAERAGIPKPENMKSGDLKFYNATLQAKSEKNTSKLNPSELSPNGLIPAQPSYRVIRANTLLSIWHPGSKPSDDPCVKKYYPEMVHQYRSIDNDVILAVLRCRTRDKNKYFVPIHIGEIPAIAPNFVIDDLENRLGWIVGGAPKKSRKPIYGMESAKGWLAKNKKILIVEGEKTCDAARRLLSTTTDAENILTLSPMGGHSSALYADWSDFMSLVDQDTLDTLTFGVWPDADPERERRNGEKIDVQALYVENAIGAFVIAARMAGLDPKKVKLTRATPGKHLKKGWDLADAEDEGWSGDRVIKDVFDRGVRMAINPEFLDMTITLEDKEKIDVKSVNDLPQEITDILDDMSEDNTLSAEYGDISDIDPYEYTAQLTSEDFTPISEMLADDIPALNASESSEGSEADSGPDDPIHTGDGEIIDGHGNAVVVLRDNPYFRCVGYRECNNYFLSLTSGQIFSVNAGAMKKPLLLSFAPLDFWQIHYVEFDNQGRGSINWDQAISDLISLCYESGYWDPKKEAGKGARMDCGRIVFNTGNRIWYQQENDGTGVVDVAANFRGEYHYTISDPCGLPDFENAYTKDDLEPRQLLELISKLNFRKEDRNLSILGLLGWLAISPICGVLPWRPHLWLDGERSSGKSWIIQNIINPVLGKYAITVKSNSTESGLRNILHSHALPLIFDEAEGEMDTDKNRMSSILKLARHSSTPGDSIVAQGVPGGNGQRYFSIASTFLLASITPQIEASADRTRFARARLAQGHNFVYFTRHLERPALDLLTPDFSARFIARMIKRAPSLKIVQSYMVEALTSCGIERRMADVWGTLATGAWLLLEDGVPRDEIEALSWIEENFSISDELDAFSAEIREDKDHDRLFRYIMAHEIKCDTINAGVRSFNIGSIVEMAITANTEEDDAIDQRSAVKILANIGIRLGHGGNVANVDDKVDSLIIHKKSPSISEILSKTPYQKSYIDVMQQADGVITCKKVVRFGGLGSYRAISVPYDHFALGDDEESND